MSFIFFVPIWLVFVATGVVFLLSPQFRFLSAYLCCARLWDCFRRLLCPYWRSLFSEGCWAERVSVSGTFRLPSGDWDRRNSCGRL